LFRNVHKRKLNVSRIGKHWQNIA